MALGEIISKQVTVLKADASQFKAEMKSAGAVEQAVMKERLAGMERQNAAMERSNQKFGLYAAAGAAAFGIVSDSVKKYEEHLKSLGPSGEAELKKLQNVTGSLSKAQENLQVSIAKVALAAGPAALALADMANELARIVGGVAGVIEQAKSLPGARYAGATLEAGIRYGMPVIGQYNMVKDTFFADDPVAYGDSWASRFEDRAHRRRLEKIRREAEARRPSGDFVINRPAAAKRRRGGGRRPVESEDPGEFLGGIWGDGAEAIDVFRASLAADRSVTTGSASDGLYAQTKAEQREVADELKKLMDELRKSTESPWESFANATDQAGERSALEKMIGPLKTFNEYSIAFGMVSDAATSAYEAIVTGSGSAAEAIRKSIGAGIMALGKDMLVRSLQEGAWAIADLAKGNLPGAALHAKAGLGFAAGAAFAGVAAASLGVGGGASASGGAGRGGYAAAGIGTGGASSGGAPVNLTIVRGDAFSQDSPRYVARRTRRDLDNARKYADYEGPPS